MNILRSFIIRLLFDGPINFRRLAPHMMAFGLGCKKWEKKKNERHIKRFR